MYLGIVLYGIEEELLWMEIVILECYFMRGTEDDMSHWMWVLGDDWGIRIENGVE